MRAAECVRRAEGRGAAGILALDLYAIQAQVALTARDTTTFTAVQKRIIATCAKVDSKAFAGRLSALLRMSVGNVHKNTRPGNDKFIMPAPPTKHELEKHVRIEAGSNTE